MNKQEIMGYFQQAVNKIKELGYDVYAYPEEKYTVTPTRTYGYVVKKDGSRFGSFQLEEPWYQSVTFSTKHKANRQCGTGFGLQGHWDAIPIDKIETKHIEECFVDPPHWAKPNDRKAALQNQWKDFDEFRNCKAFYGPLAELIKL